MEETQPTEASSVLHTSSSSEFDVSEKVVYQEKGIDLNKGFSLDFSNESEIVYNQELNLIDNFNVGSSSTSTDKNEEEESTGEIDAEPRVFSCNYCQRKFYSSQALGGHQNAHKRERTIAKRDRHLGEAAEAAFNFANMHYQHHPYNNPQYQFSSMGSLPLYGSSLGNNTKDRSLGVQVHSMINKPTPSSTSSSFLLPSSSFGSPPHQHLYGQQHPGWTSSFRPSIVDHQQTIRRLPSFVSGSMPRARMFNNGGVGGAGFLLQSGGGGGRSSSASNHQEGDLKIVDLALKL